MDEKTFAIPEEEAHKLDYVQETLTAQPLVQKVDDAIRAQPWPYVAGALALGICCGYALTR
jgi:hypothetical protein